MVVDRILLKASVAKKINIRRPTMVRSNSKVYHHNKDTSLKGIIKERDMYSNPQLSNTNCKPQLQGSSELGGKILSCDLMSR
jgi:hypothetical protein